MGSLFVNKQFVLGGQTKVKVGQTKIMSQKMILMIIVLINFN